MLRRVAALLLALNCAARIDSSQTESGKWKDRTRKGVQIMARYGLLHIYDSSDLRVRQTAATRGAANMLGIGKLADLGPALDKLVRQGHYFERILFETHGGPGRIWFDTGRLTAGYWQARRGRRWGHLVTTNARIYFNGCNVAEGPNGWKFLEAAAEVFMKPGGGSIFGQTSFGFGNPFTGNTVHLWGKTRTLYVDAKGRITERFEQ